MNLFIKHKIKFIIFIIIISSLIFSYFFYIKTYENKAISGLSFANYNLSGRNQEDIEELINKEIKKYNKTGLVFHYQDNQTSITPTVSSFEPDLAYQVISFDSKKTAENAINYTKNESFIKKISQILNTTINGKQIELEYEIKENKIKEILKANYKNLESPAENAKLNIVIDENNQVQITIKEESIGKIIDYDLAIKKLKSQLKLAKDIYISLQDKTDYPEIYSDDAEKQIEAAKNLLKQSPITLYRKNRQWLIEKEDIAKWIKLTKKESKTTTSISENKIEEFLNKEIAPNIDKKPIKADFNIEGDKVTEFQLAEKGLKLKIEENTKKIIEAINNQEKEIELIAEDINYEISDNLNLGIKEVVGTGHSNFAGSSANRRHNIKVGAETLNGMLIKPNQEFSLIQSLGDINAENNYLPELVIKGDETVAEYGGGLCQIGTTMFRTALDTGLPITERRNHSYRVSYYEPAGTDATIYSPKPDFKFLNNTPAHIMIQYRIEGNDLYFDFWGTDDGRKASTTYPVIYNIKSPPPTKYIKNDDLDPGEIKCTESAHNGADAYFDYTVTYPESKNKEAEVKERRFYSRYIPWQEVCLIGREEESTSTKEIILDEDIENREKTN